MSSFIAGGVSALLRVENELMALVLAAFVGLGLASVLRAALGERLLARRGRGQVRLWGRLGRAGGNLGLGLLLLAMAGIYAAFVLARIQWHVTTLIVAGGTLIVIAAGLLVRRWTGIAGPAGLTGGLLRAVVLLSLLVLALVTLMRAGFLALTEDRPVLIVDVTGRTRSEQVSWAPPGGAQRSQSLLTHQVVFRRPSDSAVVGEVWMYGDEVAVKGRVLRLSPVLNAAGVSNLFELRFAHNGYRTLQHHQSMPHAAYPVDPVGPLSVHPLWRDLQSRLLQMWEDSTAEGSTWMVRSSTTESTFCSLVDAEGRPLERRYRLVLTPGGLSSS